MNFPDLSKLSGTEVAVLSFSIVVLVVLTITMLVILYTIRLITQIIAQGNPEAEPVLLSGFKQWYAGLTNAVPIENEAAIILHHDYDGIKELDNHLPPWWKNLFYATIAFAAIYLLVFHVYSWKPLQTAEYKNELAQAEIDIKAYQEHAAAGINETNVTLLNKAPDLEKGKAIFGANCTPCHGKAAEGGVGPNLTDAYWLHGNKIGQVFKTIKSGIPAKGMIAWQAKLKPAEIQLVASYVLSLYNTKPANAKAPEGEKLEAPGTGGKPLATN